MGEFIITVSGTDRKNEIISENFYLDKADEETLEACKQLFLLHWTYYVDYVQDVNVMNVETMYTEKENIERKEYERLKAKFEV